MGAIKKGKGNFPKKIRFRKGEKEKKRPVEKQKKSTSEAKRKKDGQG